MVTKTNKDGKQAVERDLKEINQRKFVHLVHIEHSLCIRQSSGYLRFISEKNEQNRPNKEKKISAFWSLCSCGFVYLTH